MYCDGFAMASFGGDEEEYELKETIVECETRVKNLWKK
jgi:hypothetical protein